jgi:membrane fusion protein, macrolide-specific efflux system
MNPISRRHGGPRRGGRATTTRILTAAAVVAALAAAAACGSSSAQSGSAQPGQSGQVQPTAMQVLTKVTRGDLTQSAFAPVKVRTLGAKTVVVAMVPAQSASAVAKGQTATVVILNGSRGNFPQPGQSGFPQQGASGVPVPQGSGFPQPGQSGFPQPGASGAAGGQGGFPGGGQGGFFGGGAGSDFGGRGTPGTVTAVATNADGTATAAISLNEQPTDAKADSSGFASIQTKILASNVIIIPTAAIKGSGSSATVEVMTNGKTETRTVQVGQQSGSQSEIVSGLSEGENVVWYRSFPGFGNGQGQPGAGSQTQGGSQ